MPTPATKEKYSKQLQQFNEEKEQYNQDLEEYNEEKARYEAEHGLKQSLSDNDYEFRSGKKKPSLNDKPELERKFLKRSQKILNPYISVSKQVNPNGKTPVRMGITVEGNIIFYDKLRRGLNYNFDKSIGDGSLVHGTFFVNW